MNVRGIGRGVVLSMVAGLGLGLGVAVPSARAQFTAVFTQPTDEELKMTSQAEAPGADAVLLLREEDTESKLYSWTTHIRLKVLSEDGKKYAHVVLGQARWLNDPGQWQTVHGYRVDDIQARTIHPDGKVVLFTGGPALKEESTGPNSRREELSFDLPEVTVGSILEWSYRMVSSDNLVFTPHWEVQSELYTRKEHFMWRPMRSDNHLVSVGDKKGRQFAESIGWLTILPKDANFSHVQISGTGQMAGEYGGMIMELKVNDVPATPKEPFMEPVANTRYRVQFYYTAALDSEHYWKDEGKRLLGVEEQFMTPGPKVQEAVGKIVAPGDTEEQKLKKIYAAVGKVKNLDLTGGLGVRTRQDQAGVATAIGPVKSADEIWELQQGRANQITELFVAMARAAGFKAYLMDVANRRRNIFNPNYLNFGQQLGDTVAIVKLNGTEQYFDADVPMCPYGQLAWEHSGTAGVREIDAHGLMAGVTTGYDAELAATPAQSYKDSHNLRVADLAVDASGMATGTVKLTWTGARAEELRLVALRGDNTELQNALRGEVRRQLPAGMSVEIDGISGIDDGEKPLVVSYLVKGRVGTVKGGKLELAGELFEVGTKERFPEATRQAPVYFQYPYQNTDAVRVSFAKGMTVESAPAAAKLMYQKSAVYSYAVDQGTGSITFRRDLVLGDGVHPVAEYPELRGFFESVEKKDKEAVVVGGAAAQGGE